MPSVRIDRNITCILADVGNTKSVILKRKAQEIEIILLDVLLEEKIIS